MCVCVCVCVFVDGFIIECPPPPSVYLALRAKDQVGRFINTHSHYITLAQRGSRPAKRFGQSPKRSTSSSSFLTVKFSPVGWMTIAAMLFSAAVLVNCFLFAPVVETSTQKSLFSNTALDNFIFTSNVLFESASRSVLDCGRQCSRDERCVTFTHVTGSSSGSCRGHNVIFNSTSDQGAPKEGRVQRTCSLRSDVSVVFC